MKRIGPDFSDAGTTFPIAAIVVLIVVLVIVRPSGEAAWRGPPLLLLGDAHAP